MTYPPHKATEIGEIFVKVSSSLPKMLKRVAGSPYASSTENGITVYNLLKIKDEDLAEGIRQLTKYLSQYYIEGFRYRVEIVLPAAEALPLIGIKPPEL